MSALRLSLLVGAVVLVATLASCFDTRLIPTDEQAAGGNGDGRSDNGGASMAEAGAAAGGTEALDPLAGGGGVAGSEAGRSSRGGAAGVGEPTVTWLTLIEDGAPASDDTNAELSISGAFYAYADDCAVLNWDPASRCASGTLCAPGADYENWGIAVGFDFQNTGADGNPPETKRIWNPRDVGAVGLAWSISGKAPGLQLWVLNMAPDFDGQCSEMTCEIAGPPDGDAAAPLTGELSFDRMTKDYWGGRGLVYEFDPGAVHALQFKLPSVNVGAQSFDFCIDALGIVR